MIQAKSNLLLDILSLGLEWGGGCDGMRRISLGIIQINLGQMDQKTQRYLQRIEKIMLTPKKHNNTFRPSKSPVNCKPHNLDKYLKYELATTIVQNVVDKNHQLLVTLCFNAIRASDCRRRERIYKFVPVEKSQSLRDMQVDAAISGKILHSALKGMLRRRYVEFVNALQEAAKAAPVKVKGFTKAERRTSGRETSGYSVLKRTSTRVQEADYKVVSEWIDGTSNPPGTPRHFAQPKTQDNKKMKQLGLKILFKSIAGKIKNNNRWAMRQINRTDVPSVESNEQIDQAIIKKQQAAKRQQEKIYKFTLRILNRHLTQSYNTIRQNTRGKLLRLSSAFFFLQQRLKKINVRHKLQNYHLLFNILKSKLAEYKKNQLQPKLSPRSQRNKISSSQSSEVQPYNPLARLNFYAFVDKIFKFILIISKLLVPIKEAFIKIDQYASYSYKLQESLKVVPKRYLLDAFEIIRRASQQMQLLEKKEKIQHNPSAIAHQFYSIVLTSIHQRLIEGFIHIKIISKERTQKRIRRPSQDSIVETTKRFIMDRESYKSLSYENWSELKSTLLPPKSSSIKAKYGRNNSNILA